MKSNFAKKIVGLALSVFSISAMAQCPSITGINIVPGPSGTATLSASVTGPVTPQTRYYWQVTPGAIPISGTGTQQSVFQFPSNTTYTVCLSMNDSTTMCSSNVFCDVVTITNASTITPCNAGFMSYTDSLCNTHFINTSTGSSLTYQWSINGVGYSSTNVSVNLPNGSYFAYLFTYSSGVFCDSTFSYINVACSSGTTTPCQAAFTYNTDSACITHFVNLSTGSNLSYEWRDLSAGFSLLSTQQNPYLYLPNGYHNIALYTYSSGAFCDSANAYVYISCHDTLTPMPCQASFTYYTDSACMTQFVNVSTGSNLSYEWRDLSAGFSLLSTQQNPNIYLSNGYHNIALYTYSSGVFCDSANANVYIACYDTVSPAPCQAGFIIFADSLNPGHYFAYNTSTGSGLTYLWNFGDGTTSTLQYPFHNYASPGNYIICLTVFGDSTCSSTYCDSTNGLKLSSTAQMNQLQVIPQVVTGLKDVQSKLQMNVYPNPMSDILSLEIATNENREMYFKLTDALGRIVVSSKIESSKTELNTSAFEKGFYNLSIIDREGHILKTQKLIK